MEIRESYKWLSRSHGDGGTRLISRRALLAAGPALLLSAQTAEVSSFDLSLLDGPDVPASLFFVREHFPAPTVSSAGWKIAIRGAVEAPFEISYDELIAGPRRTLPVTLECAENPVGGGLVSHAEWTGSSLASLLQKARVAAAARFARLSGSDGFSRVIPLQKALHPDTLIVSGMNGEKLPANHGFPLRAVVPGWYGMDSVKWIRSIDLLMENEAGPQGYERQVRALIGGSRKAGPVAAMNVKSTFSRPLDGAILTRRRFTVRGAAWAGENRIRQVEVSADGGKSWATARLDSAPQPYAWVCWSYEWNIAKPGEHELTVQATDDQKREQPERRQSDRMDDFERNSWQTIRVTAS